MYQRTVERVDKLIEEGKRVTELVRPTDGYVIDTVQGRDLIDLHSWLTKTKNILVTVFGLEVPIIVNSILSCPCRPWVSSGIPKESTP